ncbi:SMP-30/gluconolactonase/LRE family protein [Nocardia sp. CDC159]|uniref:SMP-30/gluconolactonase/LRE family protein n=1 Tax=Nocardia pulmonis TaxID=2951408 RepID=A0A9X2EBV6_9NOCA|nr:MULTISPECIES: SMP-30/gluconolactonase/LRE family protein [Nocardia]MCM6776610.1 SMP-30/gluconolactonase/LRE family protein [Nocardia pulmonis]MCM6789241.1 SMP-30/gluconolactonase/LRE family protein [Nocardia sp. CDC159]
MTSKLATKDGRIVELTAEPCSVRVEHAEGPFWYDNRLGWVDSGTGVLRTAAVDGTQVTDIKAYETGQWLGSAVPKARGGWLVAAGTQILDLATDGTVTPLTPELGDPAVVQMNDGKCDPAGRFWAGFMPAQYNSDFPHHRGQLFRFDGTARPVLSEVSWSNGLAWSHDTRTMYYIDSSDYRIDAFDYDLDSGAITNRRTLVDLGSHKRYHAFDGMCIDDEGCLWVAVYNKGATTGTVHRYAPDGTLAARVHVSTPNVTSCCFGGPNGDVLFITTSQIQMTAEQRAADPNAGRIYRVEPGVGAPPATPYNG